MDIAELNKMASSHLVKTLHKRFVMNRQRTISLQADSRSNKIRIIYTVIAIVVFFLIPKPDGNVYYLVGKVLSAALSIILFLGIIRFMMKYSNFTKMRTLDEMQAFYGSIFLQTTDKYKTTPRDRNRSLKRAFNDNKELFPYPLYNTFTQNGFKIFLYEWNEILRMYPLWKIQICAIRMMFTNISVGNVKYIKIEIDYRMEERLNTLEIYNAVIELQGMMFLLTPYPFMDEENTFD